MSDNEQENVIPSAQPVAPPTQPGTIASPQRPANWPTAIGIIAIVFGTLGTLGGLLGALSPVTIAIFSEFMLPGQEEGLQQTMAWSVAYGIGGMIIAILLLIGGIRLRSRRRQAVVLIRTWAIVKILLSVGGTVIGYQSVQLQMEAIQNDPSSPIMNTGIMGTFGMVGMVVGLLWAFVLPVFMLAWFARKKIKSETESWA
ncbi:MAG: hypothetical protein IIA66_11880 [Planctomycetes bacterium]|nr:hypothetical protein [Planctomycetota bacterium]